MLKLKISLFITQSNLGPNCIRGIFEDMAHILAKCLFWAAKILIRWTNYGVLHLQNLFKFCKFFLFQNSWFSRNNLILLRFYFQHYRGKYHSRWISWYYWTFFKVALTFVTLVENMLGWIGPISYTRLWHYIEHFSGLGILFSSIWSSLNLWLVYIIFGCVCGSLFYVHMVFPFLLIARFDISH